MTTIVTTSPGFGKHGSAPQKLAETGWTIIRCTDTSSPDGGVSAHIADADFLVTGLPGVSADTLTGATRLKGILKHGVGVDTIDIPACTAKGIPVLNTPGANANAVAELALGLLFALARAIPQGHDLITGGGWSRLVGCELDGKTLGIVGLGNIGRVLARKAATLGMTIVATDPYPNAAFVREHGIEMLPLEELLARADFVSLHVFGGKANTALINETNIRLMKPTACILNLARGEVVDLDTLSAAIEDGRLGGAAIDAYTPEPPDRSHPIFANPKVIFTPHTGADTLESIERMSLMNIADIQELLDGGHPSRVLNPEVFA